MRIQAMRGSTCSWLRSSSQAFRCLSQLTFVHFGGLSRFLGTLSRSVALNHLADSGKPGPPVGVNRGQPTNPTVHPPFRDAPSRGSSSRSSQTTPKGRVPLVLVSPRQHVLSGSFALFRASKSRTTPSLTPANRDRSSPSGPAVARDVDPETG